MFFSSFDDLFEMFWDIPEEITLTTSGLDDAVSIKEKHLKYKKKIIQLQQSANVRLS